MAVVLKVVEGPFFKKNVLKETRSEVKIYVSSSYKRGTRDVIRGLSPEEERKFLPSIIGIQPDSENWDSAVKDYWANFQFRVPLDEGLKLDNSLDDKGNPVNLDDYIKYRFSLESSVVASTPEERENQSAYSVIMEDEEEVLRDQLDAAKLEVDVDKIYIKLITENNIEKKKHVFYMLREVEDGSPSKNNELLDFQLKKIKDRDLQRFKEIVEDPDLEMKVLIKLCIERNILERSGNAIFYMNEMLGQDERETILYLQNQANTKTLSALKQALKNPR